MFPLDEIANGACSGGRDQHSHTILYNILSRRESGYLNSKRSHSTVAHSCHCIQRRTVCLKDPEATCQLASSVLLKTIRFIKSLPSFSQLPSADRSSLLSHSWVPLFVLGLAQEKMAFEVTDLPNSSILRQILLGPGLSEKEADRPTFTEVHKLRACLHHLWNLDLSPMEYAYLKGVLLFNPAVPGLSVSRFVEGFQQEAQRALRVVVHLLHPDDTVRFSRVFLGASSIQTISHSLISQLFFEPIFGNTNMLSLLTDMVFVQ